MMRLTSKTSFCSIARRRRAGTSISVLSTKNVNNDGMELAGGTWKRELTFHLSFHIFRVMADKSHTQSIVRL